MLSILQLMLLAEILFLYLLCNILRIRVIMIPMLLLLLI